MNYEEIDRAIIDKVKGQQGVRFHDIYSGIPESIITPLAVKLADPDERWRIVDRRLQALKKRGALAFNRAAGWTAT